MSFVKQYKASLSGELRKEFEDYISERGISEAEAVRESIKSHIRNKHTSLEVRTRLRSIEMELKELNRKL